MHKSLFLILALVFCLPCYGSEEATAATTANISLYCPVPDDQKSWLSKFRGTEVRETLDNGKTRRVWKALVKTSKWGAIGQVQAKLGLEVNGHLNEETVAKIKKFQEEQGLEVSSCIDTQTWKKLFDEIPYPDYQQSNRSSMTYVRNKVRSSSTRKALIESFSKLASSSMVRKHYNKVALDSVYIKMKPWESFLEAGS